MQYSCSYGRFRFLLWNRTLNELGRLAGSPLERRAYLPRMFRAFSLCQLMARSSFSFRSSMFLKDGRKSQRGKHAMLRYLSHCHFWSARFTGLTWLQRPIDSLFLHCAQMLFRPLLSGSGCRRLRRMPLGCGRGAIGHRLLVSGYALQSCTQSVVVLPRTSIFILLGNITW